MDNRDLAETRNLTAPEVQDLIPAMADDELAGLRELEAADSKPRKTVLEAIDAEIERRAAARPAGAAAAGTADNPTPGGDPTTRPTATDPEAPPAPPAKAKSDAKADETPDWQKPDYAGPLDIQQGEWRRRNIKPVTQARTK